MSTLAAPRSPSPVSAPLSHPATRAVRDAEAFLDAADARLDGAAGSEPQALRLADGLLLATAAEPQYRRRFIQGCACATGIAGGGCCPGGATSAAVGGMGEMWHARSWALFAAASGKLAFALAAAYSGVKVTRNSDDAGVHLQGVRAVLVGAAHATAIALARVARHNRALTAERRAAPELAAKRGLLLRTQEALVGRQRLLRSALRDVEASLREQRFNRLVPGGLQAGAAAAMGVEAAAHLGVGALGCGVGAMAGAVAAAAFAAYGGALALKHALAWRLDVAAPALPQ
ncbi:MAG TPA: hypothetical protein VFH51_10590, partial [Myxococcota bacterium]|nr:hypothetical protein [Myxococcota bacterium]